MRHSTHAITFRFDAWFAQEPSDEADETDEFVFPACNSWLRRVVYQELENRELGEGV